MAHVQDRKTRSRGYFGREPDSLSPEADAIRTEAVKAAIEIARKAGLDEKAIAIAMQKAGATVDEIASYLNASKATIEHVTATQSTPTTGGNVSIPSGGTARGGDQLIDTIAAKAKSSPWMLVLGGFVAWRLLK